MVAQTPVGEKVKIKVIRNRKPKTLEVTIGQSPQEMAQADISFSGNKEEDAALAGLKVSDLSAEIARRLSYPEAAME